MVPTVANGDRFDGMILGLKFETIDVARSRIQSSAQVALLGKLVEPLRTKCEIPHGLFHG
jgi:hypothetical protein